MSLRFADSATVRAAERLILKGGRWRTIALKVRYGVWLDPKIGPVLIDTGYGPCVTQGAHRSRALRAYVRALGPKLNADQTATALLARHGLAPHDVALVIVTHFHADHVSELKQFAKARFILDAAALRAVRTMSAVQRLHHGIFLELLPEDVDGRTVDLVSAARVAAPLGLGEGYDLFADGTVLGIPLPGHGHGHFGLCFPNESPPLLYGVDVQWLRQAVVEDRSPGLPAELIFADRAAAQITTRRVRDFVARGGALVLCHDPEATAYDWSEVVT